MYKSVEPGEAKSQRRLEVVLLNPNVECEITAIRREQCKKSCALPACTAKERSRPETAPNMSLGSKAPAVQIDTSQAPITISFSLSSNIWEERGHCHVKKKEKAFVHFLPNAGHEVGQVPLELQN
ncbi:hypothetical protein EK904_001655 [Melospiza melodia maxima]|nr:hypothetical protein EK904_001655 [Melospiza melodia maxima]